MSKINKDEFLKYRIDILENKILNLEKRLDSVVPSNNNINMELLQMVLSMAKEPKNKDDDVLCDHKEVKESKDADDSKKDCETSKLFSFRRRTTLM